VYSPEVGQDGDGCKTVTHLGEMPRRRFPATSAKIANDGEAESEAEGVAVDFGDAD